VLRVLAARWIGLPAGGGQHFLLDARTLCVLGYYRDLRREALERASHRVARIGRPTRRDREDESMSDTKRERAGRQRDSKHAITRDRTVELINQLRDQGFKVAVVTSSQNCTAVSKAAKLDHCFDVQVDCDVIHAEHLAGKPAPDTYLMAAKSVVIEDALAGMEAGSREFRICDRRRAQAECR